MKRLGAFGRFPLSDRYRSDQEDVVKTFFVPAFTVATSYSRAVGYFTSTSLALYARGIETFAERGGSMRLIASPHLNEDDVVDIERGYDVRAGDGTRHDARAGAEDQPETVLDGLGLLGRLIAEGRLDIKLAFVQQEGRVGIYHEKIGIFRDDLGDLVGFTGSSNETFGGLMANFESVEVYRGWVAGDGARALRPRGRLPGAVVQPDAPPLSVERFPDVARERLIKLGSDRPPRDLPGTDDALTPTPADGRRADPTDLARTGSPCATTSARQSKSWLGNQGRGILKMATGTGKTKTAMIAATQLGDVLRQREQPLVLLIVAPLHSPGRPVDHRGRRASASGRSRSTSRSQKWLPLVEEQLAAGPASGSARSWPWWRPTRPSRARSSSRCCPGSPSRCMVIADEAHNLGSSAYRSSLPANATYRLALSATPERWFDDDGTDALIDYFGPIVFELGLGEAIEMGALMPLRLPASPRRTQRRRDAALYVDLSAQIATRIASGDNLKDADPNSPLGFLLRQRAGVLGHAEGKLAALRADLDARRD